jgi:hypothetical protein
MHTCVDKREIETLGERGGVTGHDEVMPKSMEVRKRRRCFLVKAARGDNSKVRSRKIANNLQTAEG